MPGPGMSAVRHWVMAMGLALAACSPLPSGTLPAEVGNAPAQAPHSGQPPVPALPASAAPVLPLAGQPAAATSFGIESPAVDTAVQAAYEAGKRSLLPLLAAGTPRDRLAARLLQDGPLDAAGHAGIVGLLLADGGRDPWLATHGLRSCAQWPGCPRETVLAVTAAVAAEDAQLQLLRLRLGDPAAQEAMWAMAAHAPVHADLFEYQVEALMAATGPLATPPAQDRMRAVQVIAVTVAQTGDELGLVNQRCPTATVVTERVQQCRQLARPMVESPTLVTARVGLAVLLRQALAPGDAAPWQALQRQLQWQLALAAPRLDAEPTYPQQIALHGERAAIAWLLRRHGLPLDPPAHWRPGQPTGY